VHSFRFLQGLAVVLGATALAAPAEVVVVVNPRNPVATLTRQQVSLIYSGRLGSFPTGTSVTPLDLGEGTALRDEFYAKVTGRNPGEVRAYWSKQLFSGNGTPPRELATMDDVKRNVASDPSAIGYIDRAALDASVKEVLSVR